MERRCFWQIPDGTKFRVVFENDELLVGATEENRYQTFRRDSPSITFSETEAAERSFSFRVARETSLWTMFESVV